MALPPEGARRHPGVIVRRQKWTRGNANADMTAYLIRRLLFMIPTLLGIMLVAFVVVQFAPGGPVERVIAQLSGPAASPAAPLRWTR